MGGGRKGRLGTSKSLEGGTESLDMGDAGKTS